MTTVPANPKIYHITHIDNLSKIVADGKLWSDAKRLEKSLDCKLVLCQA
ncbi:MAG: DarT ssDNA thymidine ADP-ribosyltransferase family protein [Planctomycetaceae bacterium]